MTLTQAPLEWKNRRRPTQMMLVETPILKAQGCRASAICSRMNPAQSQK